MDRDAFVATDGSQRPHGRIQMSNQTSESQRIHRVVTASRAKCVTDIV